MRRLSGFLVLLILGGCSRSNFNVAEAQFVDSLNSLESIHSLLVEVNSESSLQNAEQKIPALMDGFDRLRSSTEPISYQLGKRLIEKYRMRQAEAWNGIKQELWRLRHEFDSPVLLKVEAWLAKMIVNE